LAISEQLTPLQKRRTASSISADTAAQLEFLAFIACHVTRHAAGRCIHNEFEEPQLRSTLKSSGSALAAALSLALLSACGGGGESVTDSGPGHSPGGEGKDGPAVVAVVCPDSYRTATLDSVIPDVNFTLSEGDARFNFSFPGGGHVSAKVCIGKPAEVLSQEGYVPLSDTYEVLVQSPLPNGEEGDPTVRMQQFTRELSIAFPRKLLPEGTTNEQMIDKVRIYSPDASGVWQPQPGGVVTPAADSADPELPLNIVTAAPNDSGRFVVAFKP
jgi:hypothetical protein